MSARRLTSNKRMKNLIVFAERHGWVIEKTKGGHLRWKPPVKDIPWVITPASPSDARGYMDDRARLRRHGLPREGSP